IYSILKSQGHPYQEIEEAMYKLVKGGTQPTDAENHLVKPDKTQMPTANAKPEQMPPKIKTEKSASEIPQNLNSEFAPLFVKIDKYNETIETLGNLQIYLKEMSKLFELSNELERIRASNISAMNKMYSQCTETAERLYGGLLKPKGMKMEGERRSQAEIGKLDDVISDLNKELSVLRDEVDRIKNID
ncbi:MAG: hypothetical protein KAU95_02900, partial [Candidatus Aenigmarchaeota archaeon]|nr:hypothetical protein [Candidatus Aenigmarchaeota archaeon]